MHSWCIQYMALVCNKLLQNQRSLNKWILLQFYRITAPIYELLQRAQFAITKVFKALYRALSLSFPSVFCVGCIISGENCKLALLHMDTNVAFTNLCILSVIRWQRKCWTHTHAFMYKLLYLDMQSTKHVTSINVSHLIFIMDIWRMPKTQPKCIGTMMIWKMQCKIGQNALICSLVILYVPVEWQAIQAKNVLQNFPNASPLYHIYMISGTFFPLQQWLYSLLWCTYASNAMASFQI